MWEENKFCLRLGFLLFICFHALISLSQNGWSVSGAANPVFTESKGQFVPLERQSGRTILFSAMIGPEVYFTPDGIIYCMSEGVPMTEAEKRKYLRSGSEKHLEEEEKENERLILHNHYVNMEWVGANPNPQVVGEDKAQAYSNYLNPLNPKMSIDHLSGFGKIIYKDLYPNIDVEYVFSPKGGMKYALILHPGADVSLVKMRYGGADRIFKDADGNISFSTAAGNITDHAPQTSYGSGGEAIASKFNLERNTVSFDLGTYDYSRAVIIDPWINSSLVPSYTPVELSVDGANNVYAYGFTGQQTGSGGGPPLNIYVQKFNPAGALIWTFNFTNAMNYLQNTGDIVVDPAGNSYVTNGFYMIGYFVADCMQSKLTPAGSLSWNLVSPQLYENWRNDMNCDYTQLVQLGCGPGCCNVGKGDIVNVLTGAESGLFAPPIIGDIVSSSYGKNGYLYLLSVEDMQSNPPPHSPHLTCLNPATAFSVVFSIPFVASPTFVDGIKSNYGTNGFNALDAGCSFLYVSLGATIQKRDLNSGALLASAAIPGGTMYDNSGTAVDGCGNVYVGSSQGVYVFNSNLSLLTSFATPLPVFDIVIGKQGIFYACGGSSTATTNKGFVAQFSMASICNPITITSTPNSCGGSNIGTATATPLFCAGPYTYQWNPTGQTTQTATGLATGSYTVVVTGSGACNEKDTAVVNITGGLLVTSIPPPTNVSCFGGNNGTANATVTGGTAPFTYAWNPTGQTTQTVTGLSTGTYSVIVTDASGCTGTQTITITQPAALTASVTSTTGGCGGNNGTASVSAAGGTNVFTYNWNPSAQTTQTASNLAAGNYTVTVTDGNGCTATASVIIANPGNIVAVAGPNSTICAGQTLTLNSSGGTNYSWSTGATNAAVSVSPTANTTYSVIVSSGTCSDTAFVTVIVKPSPALVVTGNTLLCIGDTAVLTASGGTNYLWNNGSTSAVITVIPTVSTSYSVTSTNGTCTSVVPVNVVVGAAPTAVVSSTTLCSGQTGILTAGGGGTYSWSSGQSTSSIVVSAAATYSVIVSVGSCADTAAGIVVVNPSPTASISGNVTILAGSSATLSAGGGGNYSWSTGDTTSEIFVTPAVTTTYTVVVTGPNGCADTALVTVYVIEPIVDCSGADLPDVFILPNAFSPNSDGQNEKFHLLYGQLLNDCVKDFYIAIYNRWGEKIYEGTTLDFSWDGTCKGKPEDTAVFAWYLNAILMDGVEVKKKGNVSLLR